MSDLLVPLRALFLVSIASCARRTPSPICAAVRGDSLPLMLNLSIAGPGKAPPAVRSTRAKLHMGGQEISLSVP
eukprot:13180447-Heterocapsa_arctica.AAC.1